jgi:hypothetical protein
VTPRYIRNEPNRRETVGAAVASVAVAVGVGLVSFYIIRLLIAREPVGRDASESAAE